MPWRPRKPDLLSLPYLFFGSLHLWWALFSPGYGGPAYEMMEKTGGIGLWAAVRSMSGLLLVVATFIRARKLRYIASFIDAALYTWLAFMYSWTLEIQWWGWFPWIDTNAAAPTYWHLAGWAWALNMYSVISTDPYAEVRRVQ